VHDLTVERLGANRSAEGRILTPDGQPAPAARITLLEVASYPLTGARTDEDGRFVLPLTAGLIYDLVADDPLGRWCRSIVHGVPAGTRGLEIHLVDCQPTLVAVRDDRNRPVSYFGFSLSEDSDPSRVRQCDPALHAGGILPLEAPPGVFHLFVFSPGYEG